jgi:hypothetical protein
MLAKLAAHLAGDALSIAGMQDMALTLVLPSATSMALTLSSMLLPLLLDIALQALLCWPNLQHTWRVMR